MIKNMFLLFDTETSGMVKWTVPHTSESQPHLVQLAARLCTEDGICVQSFEWLIRPDGWEIEAQATEVHGLSTEFCLTHGMPLRTALQAFNLLCRRAQFAVAWNIKFDDKVILAAYHRAQLASDYSDIAPVCAMNPMTKICKIPKGRGYKWPSLTEAHQHYFGCAFEGAHGAMTDTIAMQRVFFEMHRRAALEAPA